MNTPMFQDDILCVRCANWYIPQELSDDNHICPSCKRIAKRTGEKRVLLNEINSQITNILRSADSDECEGFVYFIQGVQTKLIKVGYSANVVMRMKEHQTGSPDILKCICYTYGTFEIENQFHRLLIPFVSHGEWFNLPDQIWNHIKRRTRPGLPIQT